MLHGSPWALLAAKATGSRRPREPQHATRLAVTCGDPAGIGPEIVLKALAHAERPDAEWVVYGPLAVLDARRASSA